MRTKEKTILFFALAISLGALYVHPWTILSQTPKYERVSGDFQTTAPYWQREIQKVGGALAYEELSQSLEGSNPGTQHGMAHIFGGALYATEGLGGFSVCDTRFSYGCFHEFVGRAIAARGVASAKDLNNECKKLAQSSACQHGIGHGVLGSLGYTPKDLTEALSICTDLEHNDPMIGCESGVFMEYNLRTMLGTQNPVRPVDARGGSTFYEPCVSLTSTSTILKQSCVFLLAQWWWVLFEANTNLPAEIKFSEMGKRCNGLPEDMQKICFEGMGQLAPPAAGFDAVGARKLCENASKERAHQLQCKNLAANVFFNVDSSQKVLEMCKDLQKIDRATCEEFATGVLRIEAQPGTHF